MVITTTFIFVLLFIQGSLCKVTRQSPIVGIAGGRPVDIADAPFMAALIREYNSNHYMLFSCGASIVHQQFVLTAAHCLRLSNFTIIVHVGSSDLNQGGSFHDVEKYLKHPLFPPAWGNDHDYDLALLKLFEPVTFGPGVAAIKLADVTNDIPIGLTANVTGWGYTENSRTLQVLRQAAVTVVSTQQCTRRYPSQQFRKMICVQNVDKGSCMGDSGGPLTVNDLQIGIVSWGGYGCPGTPDGYVKVAAHLQWINDTINENL